MILVSVSEFFSDIFLKSEQYHTNLLINLNALFFFNGEAIINYGDLHECKPDNSLFLLLIVRKVKME